MRLYQVCWLQVCHPAEQVECPVPHGDQGVLAEQDGLGPVGRLGELGKYYPSYTGLSKDQLLSNVWLM